MASLRQTDATKMSGYGAVSWHEQLKKYY